MASNHGAQTIAHYSCFSNGSIQAPPYDEEIKFGVAQVPMRFLETKLRQELGGFGE